MAQTSEKKPCPHCAQKAKICKPSEVIKSIKNYWYNKIQFLLTIVCFIQLPIYGNPYPPKDRILTSDRGMLENAIRTARLELASSLKVFDSSTKRAREILDTAVAHSKCNIKTNFRH